MPSFTTTIDGQPHTWTLAIHLGHVAAIQAAFPDFRLERILLPGDPAYESLTNDSTLLVHVLRVLLSDQMQLSHVTTEKLLGSLAGAVIDEIIKALIEAVGFFSPARAGKVRAAQMVQILEAMQKADQTGSGDSSGTAPPVPELSPGGTA